MSKKVFIIGSVSQEEELRKVADIYASLGSEVDYPRKSCLALSDLIMQAFQKIDDADLIVAIPKSDGTYGDGTLYELIHACNIGKKVITSIRFSSGE